jgi:hypothetical protein
MTRQYFYYMITYTQGEKLLQINIVVHIILITLTVNY